MLGLSRPFNLVKDFSSKCKGNGTPLEGDCLHLMCGWEAQSSHCLETRLGGGSTGGRQII